MRGLSCCRVAFFGPRATGRPIHLLQTLTKTIIRNFSWNIVSNIISEILPSFMNYKVVYDRNFWGVPLICKRIINYFWRHAHIATLNGVCLWSGHWNSLIMFRQACQVTYWLYYILATVVTLALGWVKIKKLVGLSNGACLLNMLFTQPKHCFGYAKSFWGCGRIKQGKMSSRCELQSKDWFDKISDWRSSSDTSLPPGGLRQKRRLSP